MRRGALLAAAIAALALPGVARAADTIVAADPAVADVAALDGTIVWTSGQYGTAQTLMVEHAGTIAAVAGAPPARYDSIDLGRDAHGKLVLTYLRCRSKCLAIRDDLHGHRMSYLHLKPKRCMLSTGPALWGRRIAYGLTCYKGSRGQFYDLRRSGPYVKTGQGTPRRLGGHKALTQIDSIDLRDDRVGAIAVDAVYIAFTERVDGSRFHSFGAAQDKGATYQVARAVTLASDGAMWTLATSEAPDVPSQTVISRQVGGCRRYETLTKPTPAQLPASGQLDYPASSLAVDEGALYLVVGGTGIVRHDFAPTAQACS